MDDLHSIEACRNLIADYVQCIDAQDDERLRERFVPDARFARPTDPDTVIRGVDAIIAAFAARPRTRPTQHLMAQTRITLEGPDAATGLSSLALYTADAAEPSVPGKARMGSGPLLGLYSDRFARTAEGWRFAERLGRVTLHT